MTQVTLTFLEPRVELVFDDEEVSLISSVDADTVMGVTPGTVGLLVLATNTQAEAQAAIGVSSSEATVSAISGQVGAHERKPHPHPFYAREDQVALTAAFFGG